MADKTKLPSEGSPKTITTNIGSAKTVSTVYAYKHGIVTVLEFIWSDTTSTFVKFNGSGLEIGGTLDMGTGTAIKW